jgi:hypothetical protein
MHHDAAERIPKITDLGRNDAILWPGALIQGKSNDLEQFRYVPISGVFRNPEVLSINFLSASTAPVTKTVDNPTLSSVTQGINDLLSTAISSGSTYPARASFEKREVYNEQQLTMKTGANFSYGAGSGSAKFDRASTTKKTKLMATYYQEYYSISMDTPQTPAAVFSTRNTLDDIRAALPAGSTPLYVSSVTYGMMAMCFIETDYSESQMDASLDAAYGGLSLDAEVSVGLTKRQVLQNSHITTVVYGGSSAGLGSIFDGYAGFVSVVQASIHLGTSSPGVPLRYTLTNLADNTTAQVSLTSQYSVDRRVRIQQAIKIVADNFTMVSRSCDDCGLGCSLEMYRFYVQANATQRTTATDPGVQYCLADTMVFKEELSESGLDMTAHDQVQCGGASVSFQLDAEHYDYSLATLKIVATAAEYDGTGCDSDWAAGTITIPSSQLQDNPHQVTVTCGQFTLTRDVHIEMLNGPADGPLAGHPR